jgi:hypothetical protein
LARVVFTVFALITFFVQGLATQTHVHFPGDRDIGVSISDWNAAPVLKASSSQNGEHGKLPAKDDPANCPLCQQITIAGAFVSPSYVGLAPPIHILFAAPSALAILLQFRTVSHSWHGRAPPTA